MSEPMAVRATSQADASPLLRAALSELTGPALLLDADLRLVDWTEGTEDAVGAPLERGVLAPRVLCGHAEDRPVAEALAAGRPVVAEVLRPTPQGVNRVVHVQTLPIERQGQRVGWLVTLSPRTDDPACAPVVRWGLLTQDPSMKGLLDDVGRVAASDAGVLVRGETGTGKELVARAIHLASPRADGPFRTLNCAALPANLLESELFGHTRGAFTGAVRDKPGHFVLAHGGTLFLDEVAELPLDLQAKLLRALADGSIFPLGATEPVQVDVRIVAATHQSLRRAVEEGRFRDDLMYRLRVVPLYLPPLRERRGDIALLAWHFVARHNGQQGRHVAQMAPAALRTLTRYPWPGNVRELENAIQYAFVMGEGPVLKESELPLEIRSGEVEVGPPSRRVNEPSPETEPLPAEAQRIVNALERAGGHRERAAASLGISRSTLWRRMREHGIEL
jgi:transcriptional regulator with PAS, ATPase and Fis domain